MIIRIFNGMRKRHRNNKKGPVRHKECKKLEVPAKMEA